MNFQQLIEKHWYIKNNRLLSLILLPFTAILFCMTQIHYYLYKFHLLKRFKLPVPVVIIGNISVGGVGKTPLTQYLATTLTSHDISVGVIMRGYKGQVTTAMVVNANDNSTLVGDEALIYAKNDIRVAIGTNRYLAGLALLKKFPDIQLIISDDGLQHYRLERNYEVIVIDSSRMFGNYYTLPMGPLRERCTRLKKVNAVVFNGTTPAHPPTTIPLPPLVIEQTLILDKIYNPYNNKIITPSELQGKSVVALAGIGNPQRFFDFVTNSGIVLQKTISFPDHYDYKITDIPHGYTIILVTDKDYAKLYKFNSDIIYIVQVKVKLNTPKLVEQLIKLVPNKNNRENL